MWTLADIPDLTGKQVIITGANSGLGFEATKVLAARGAKVILACRNLQAVKAVDAIRESQPSADVMIEYLDLANLASISEFAKKIVGQGTPVDILMNNAGVMALPRRVETIDGFEMQFGTNHLGHFVLTAQLMPAILNTAGSRIITESSSLHAGAQMDFTNLNAEQKYGRWRAYRQSKLANLLFTYELQRRLASAGRDTLAAAAQPGLTDTNLHKGAVGKLIRFIAKSAAAGALPQLRAATDPAVRGGEYYGPRGSRRSQADPVVVKSSEASHDEYVAERLWELSEKLTDVQFQI